MTVLAASLLLAGCSTAPRPAPPTGDIPAASPSPAPTPALDEPGLLDAEQAGAPMGTPSLPPRPTAVSTVAAEKTAGPARTARPSVPRVRLRHVLSGVSMTWYCLPGRSRCTKGYNAAGSYVAVSPDLQFLRGRVIAVCRVNTCVRARVVDCNCRAYRSVDAYASVFRQLAPLSAGRVTVEVRW